MISVSGDKDRVLKEAFRALKPGGRFAVSDLVVRGVAPPAIRRSGAPDRVQGGALSNHDFMVKRRAAGLVDIGIEVKDIDDANDCGRFGEEVDTQASVCEVGDQFASAFVRAVKPLASIATDSSQ